MTSVTGNILHMQVPSAYIYRMAETSCIAMSQPHYSNLTQKDNSCTYMLRVKLSIIDYKHNAYMG